mmetsp:Transcript_31002/g.43430  ORF Transcript_31002/g.43430 Transcript_31002/m.43430 type:complete len:494 (-) Transcript_31002:1165-2646(-)
MHLESINFLKKITKPLNFLISHYHLDHIGSLPLILNYGSDKNLSYSTYLTKLLFFYNSKEFLNFTDKLKIKSFNQDDIEMVMELIISVKENTVKMLRGNNIATFFNSGHSLGSSCINLNSLSFSLLYTGDYSKNDSLVLKGVSYYNFNFDLLIIEDTIGAKNYLDGKRNERFLYRKISNSVYKKKCTIVFPVSSFINLLNILLILFKFMSINKKKVKVIIINHKLNDLKNNSRKLINYFNSEIINKNYGFDENIYQIVKTSKSLVDTLHTDSHVIITSPDFFNLKSQLPSLLASNRNKYLFILTEFYQKFTVSSIINMKPIVIFGKSSGNKNKIKASKVFFYCHPSKNQIIEDLIKLNLKIVNFVHITQKGAQRLFNLLKNRRRNFTCVEYFFCNKSKKAIQIFQKEMYGIVYIQYNFRTELKVYSSLKKKHLFSYLELYKGNKRQRLKNSKSFFSNQISITDNRLIKYYSRSKKLLIRMNTIILKIIIILSH